MGFVHVENYISSRNIRMNTNNIFATEKMFEQFDKLYNNSTFERLYGKWGLVYSAWTTIALRVYSFDGHGYGI